MKFFMLSLYILINLCGYCQKSLGVRFIVTNDTMKKSASIKIDMTNTPSNVMLYNVICHMEEYDKNKRKIRDFNYSFTSGVLRYLSGPNSYFQKYLFNDKSIYAIKGVRLSFDPYVIGQTASTNMNYDSTLLAELNEIQFEKETLPENLLPQKEPYIVRNCPPINFSDIIFVEGTATLTPLAKATLTSLSKEIKDAPCKLKISGSTMMHTTAQQDLGFKRLQSITNYLVKNEGLNSNKFILTFEPTIDINKVSLMSANY